MPLVSRAYCGQTTCCMNRQKTRPSGMSAATTDTVMTDAHRHFVQSLMTQGVLCKRAAKVLAKKIQQLYENEETPFHEFVGVVNSQLEPLGFKVGLGKLEQDGSEWVGLVNTVGDFAAKKGSSLGLANLEFVRHCIQHIVSEDSGSVSSSVLLGLVDNLQRKMTKKAVQELLNSLVADHWLVEERRGYYSMGPRCILELLPFLQEITGQEVDECQVCSNNVVMGQRCVHCGTKLHLYCVARLAEMREQVKCPQCHEEWEHDVPNVRK